MAAQTSVDESTLRSAIQQRLRDDGVFEEIASLLRLSVKACLQPNTIIPNANCGLEETAWRSLIYHFLDDRNLVHTLSVYSVEGKIEGKDQAMSVDDCLKALSLTSAWLQWKKFDCSNRHECVEEGDIQILLRAVSNWSTSHQHSLTDRPCVSVSVQTDACESNKENEHGNQNDEQETRKSIAQHVLDIERDLRHQFNEKLRLSAKKQASNAMRRLEEKHKEEINTMQSKIDAERAKSEAREKDMEKERIEFDRKLERIMLEKDTLESDVGLMNEVKKTQMKEWAVKHDELEQQKRRLQSELNKIHCRQDSIKATELRCVALQEEQDSWLSEREELLDEIKLLRKHLMSLHKAKDIIQQSFTQLKSDHVALSQKHQIKENSLQKDVSQLQFQLQELEEKHRVAMASAEKTGYEVTNLRSLLKQSQSALESVTFRDDDNVVHDVTHTRGLLRLTPSARPQITSRPHSALVSTSQFGTTSKLLSVRIGNEANPNKQNECLPPRKDDSAIRHYLEHPPSKSNTTPVFVAEDPPSSFGCDPPDGSSDIFQNETVHQSKKSGSFRHQLCATAKPQLTCDSLLESTVQDQPDDVSAISEAVSDFAPDPQSSSRATVLPTREEQSEIHKSIRKSSSSGYNGVADLTEGQDGNKSDDLNDCNSLKRHELPLLYSPEVSAPAPNSTFQSDYYSTSFHSEDKSNADSCGVKGALTQDDPESANATATADSFLAQKMTEPAISSGTESNCSEERDAQNCAEQSNTPRSLSSSSSSHGGYSASFCTEE